MEIKAKTDKELGLWKSPKNEITHFVLIGLKINHFFPFWNI